MCIEFAANAKYRHWMVDWKTLYLVTRNLTIDVNCVFYTIKNNLQNQALM